MGSLSRFGPLLASPWARRLTTFAVAGAALTILVVATAPAAPIDPAVGAPPALDAAARSIFADQDCVRATDADASLQAMLAQGGFAGWSIFWAAGVSPQGCVSWGYDAAKRQILLLAVARAEVRTAMQAVRERMFRECFDQAGAVAAVREALAKFGENDPVIHTDGPIMYPASDATAMQEHADAGCFFYGGITWTSDGQPIYLVGGK